MPPKIRQSIVLIQMGTFLEYFDLMLYVHMMGVLNKVFFPHVSGPTQSFLEAFSFCITFVLNPFGAIIFGYVGDKWGRRYVIISSSFLMGLACFVMMIAPSYAKVGLYASALFLMCRALQGLSSLGEVTTAQIYLTEITNPPLRYSLVASIGVLANLGGLLALGVALAVTYLHISWRYAFFLGCTVSLVGIFARRHLLESPDFLDPSSVLVKKESPQTFFAAFIRLCAGPLSMYFSYVYCSTVLTNNFCYTPQNIIFHNLWVCLIECVFSIFYVGVVYHYPPLKLARIRWVFYGIFALIVPFCLKGATHPFHIFLVQLMVVFASDESALGVLYKHLSPKNRTFQGMMLFAGARSFVYVIASFSAITLTSFVGVWGLWAIFLPFVVCYKKALCHFETLEEQRCFPRTKD